MGVGSTRQEALSDLHRRFENFKVSGQKLPRPGASVPVKFA
jgi:hypothetical protein